MKQKDISQGSAATRFRRNRSNEALVQIFVARILKKKLSAFGDVARTVLYTGTF